MSKLKLDLAQEGLLCVLKPYQAEIMRLFWETGESQDSRSVYDHIQTVDVETKSRASVINYMNDMVEEGFLDYVEKSGKGGYKRVYSLNDKSETERHFRDTVSLIVMEKLNVFLDPFWKRDADVE